jgi:CBS domain-containing protein
VTTVREIMRTDLVVIAPNANLTEAAHAMAAGEVGSVLVLEDGALVGIFTERDILRALAASASADQARVSAVSAWMTTEPQTVTPDTLVGEALDVMLFGGFRHVPVVEGDRVVGMVSMRDLAKRMVER